MATSRLRLQKMIAFLRSLASRSKRRSTSRFSCGSRPTTDLRTVSRSTAAVAGLETSIFSGLCRKVSVISDFRRHRRSEEQCLPREGNQLADAFDIGNEFHVQHTVGFIDHQKFDAGEQQTAAFGMVEQAARRCDQDVDAARQFGVLVAERDAADQKRDVVSAGAIFVELSFTWAASSRVGSRIRVRGIRARARPFSSMVSMGRTKAAVLPVPVWAMPKTSRRARTWGIA